MVAENCMTFSTILLEAMHSEKTQSESKRESWQANSDFSVLKRQSDQQKNHRHAYDQTARLVLDIWPLQSIVHSAGKGDF